MLYTLIGLALTAIMLEIATMLPFLATIGLIAVEKSHMVNFYSSAFGLLYCNGTSCIFDIGRPTCCSQTIEINTC